MLCILSECGPGGEVDLLLILPTTVFLARKVRGCQTAKPAWSLFECQNGRRGKGSRKLVIKIPTTLLIASPQPAFVSLSGPGGEGLWGSAVWLRRRGQPYTGHGRDVLDCSSSSKDEESYSHVLLPVPHSMFNTKPSKKQPSPQKRIKWDVRCYRCLSFFHSLNKRQPAKKESTVSAKYLHPAWKFSLCIIITLNGQFENINVFTSSM